MDYKEYSKLRSIARKRIERASAAGLAPYVYIPTVKEVRASDNPEQFMYNVRRFLETGTTVRNIRKAPETKFPVLDLPQLPPGVAKQKPLTPEQKRSRKNLQNRRSKAKRAVEKAAATPEQAKQRTAILKALWTMADQWREAGVDAGNWLFALSPKQAKQFVDYVNYRFAQGDFNMKYVIDEFSKDFGELRKQNYSMDQIQEDFGKFLIDQKMMSKRKKDTTEYGLYPDEVNDAWAIFVGRADRADWDEMKRKRARERAKARKERKEKEAKKKKR